MYCLRLDLDYIRFFLLFQNRYLGILVDFIFGFLVCFQFQNYDFDRVLIDYIIWLEVL